MILNIFLGKFSIKLSIHDFVIQRKYTPRMKRKITFDPLLTNDYDGAETSISMTSNIKSDVFLGEGGTYHHRMRQIP